MLFAPQVTTLGDSWRVAIRCPQCEQHGFDPASVLALAGIRSTGENAAFLYGARVPASAKLRALVEQISDDGQWDRALIAGAPPPSAQDTRDGREIPLAEAATRTQFAELLDDDRHVVTCKRGHREQITRPQILRKLEAARAAGTHTIAAR